jgi:glucose/arabinose dehydrogenase
MLLKSENIYELIKWFTLNELNFATRASQKLYRCIVEGNKITNEETLLSNAGRIRNVIQAPDGTIYVSAEGPGKIIQIIPN